MATDVRGRSTPAMDTLVTAAIAFAAGVMVALAAFLTARYGPSGPGWSFRGNGALAVYTAVPALLASGWTAAVLRSRQSPHWLRNSLMAGLAGLVLAAADALLLPVFGTRGDQTAGPLLLLALAAWAFATPAWAFVATRDRQIAAGAALADAAAWLGGIMVGLVATSFVLPPGS